MPRHARTLALLLPAIGCAGVQVHSELSPGAAVPARVVAVYPVGLRWNAPAYRSYELAMDEVGAILSGGRLSALGPTELKLMDPHSDSIYAATDLASTLAERGLRPDELVALRGWVERRETSDTELLVDTHGKPVGQRRNADVRLVIHEELLGPTPGAELAEVSAEVPVDPFADHPTWDDLPELRRWIARLTTELLDRARPRLGSVPRPVSESGLELTLNPRDEDGFVVDGHPSLDVLLAQLGPVDREAARLDRLLYFDPLTPPTRGELFAKLPQGLFVDRVRSPAARAAGVRPGDLLVEIEGEPAAGPQTLLRWLSTKRPGEKLSLVVLRDGARQSLAFPVPER